MRLFLLPKFLPRFETLFTEAFRTESRNRNIFVIGIFHRNWLFRLNSLLTLP